MACRPTNMDRPFTRRHGPRLLPGSYICTARVGTKPRVLISKDYEYLQVRRGTQERAGHGNSGAP